ncbi:signal peptidase I [Alkaliphilus pronyensis]|uniref:Signal peptidase I n=1 Tax=Alkaliphilus pronyensis TaxID=1482732 RepID=A0A6I0F8U0_9FIRM|nr:signal peptidase I [Alkaliphilus pronyensis]KAB3532737.1 signal peptidase I [Alkaliphilus pronyensis]
MENHSLEIQDNNKNNNKMNKFKIIASNIFIGIMGVIIIGMLIMLFQSKQTQGPPSIAGHQMYIVLSGSMSPTFKTGSIIFVKEANPEDIKVNDIITYTGNDGGSATTHRVVGIHNEGTILFQTRGDANNMDDPLPVPAKNVVGVVKYSIPLVGYVFSFARTKEGFLLLMIVPGAIIIVTQLFNLFKYIKEAKES